MKFFFEWIRIKFAALKEKSNANVEEVIKGELDEEVRLIAESLKKQGVSVRELLPGEKPNKEPEIGAKPMG